MHCKKKQMMYTPPLITIILFIVVITIIQIVMTIEYNTVYTISLCIICTLKVVILL